MTRRGAQSWRGWPVRAPADLVLSRGDLLCRSHLGAQQCHLWKQYGPARWFVIQQNVDGRSHNNPIELLRQHGWASSDGMAAWTLVASPTEPLPRGGQQSHVETDAAAAAGCTNVLMKVHGSDDVTLCAYGAFDADPASEEIRRYGRLAASARRSCPHGYTTPQHEICSCTSRSALRSGRARSRCCFVRRLRWPSLNLIRSISFTCTAP